jgi:membrane-associated phospholipid phosphatase
MKQTRRKTTTRSIYVHSPDYLLMTRPEPQDPHVRTLRRWTGTRLLGGTTSENEPDPAPTGEASARLLGPVASTPPLLPARTRRPAAVTAVCCAVIVAVLGVVAFHRSQANPVDRPVDSWLRQQLGSHWQLMSHISYLGGGQVVTLFTAVLIVACLAVRRVNAAAITLISVVAAGGLTEYVLKPLVHETFQHAWLSYPSGHTTSLFALITVVGVLLTDPPRWRPRPGLRLLIMAGLSLVGCAVAVAMTVLQYHYFTDTIAGAAWGTCVALAATFLLDAPAVRRVLGSARLRPGRAS